MRTCASEWPSAQRVGDSRAEVKEVICLAAAGDEDADSALVAASQRPSVESALPSQEASPACSGPSDLTHLDVK